MIYLRWVAYARGKIARGDLFKQKSMETKIDLRFSSMTHFRKSANSRNFNEEINDDFWLFWTLCKPGEKINETDQ